ncbi:hypothetical protein MKY07_09380 [Solibacillus sp. FSL W7-1472]|uniref:Uncharacterized protein n=1 Tax=Solibacillus isronensis B3W22 TaxID=1224748 RepID=K1KPL7_9BACL|nr:MULTISPECIES: hypothetical protein [Solibacillus]AMO85535.1 hypothetical protein SOLI23_08035 [Solibacillus silvestris]EKB44431.1 hypothetical protein B857_02732 [Solibacillus isronensis B3W22]OBW60472.1 hypothetical protein A9986_04665 [Solibacillus silvestris]
MAISMMEAYTIELLKNHPYTFEQIKHFIENDELHLLTNSYDIDTDSLRILLKENAKEMEQAFAGNYEVKFVTMNGLKNLLRMRFQISDDQYELLAEGNGLHFLQVDSITEQQIRGMLSSNWKVERSGEQITLYV